MQEFDALGLWASKLTSEIEEILPYRRVLQEMRSAVTSSQITPRMIGRSEVGWPIPAYEFGSGEIKVLLYGFPDPGEAIGGTTCLALLRGFLNSDSFLGRFRWLLIPCLNPDDQPYDGKKLGHVMRSPHIREVDWCIDSPRSETTALLKVASEFNPHISFPLHDEFHCGDAVPAYFVLHDPLRPNLCDQLREWLGTIGLPISAEYAHSSMGTGFFQGNASADYYRSTFHALSQYGNWVVAELSAWPGVTPAELVAAQLGIIRLVLESQVQETQ